MSKYRRARQTLGAAIGFAVSSTWMPEGDDIVALSLASILAAVSLTLFFAARASTETHVDV
jgi:hypothetical protein